MPLTLLSHDDHSVQERIRANVTVNDAGCWIWNRSLGTAGYGQMYYQAPGERARMQSAHRTSYRVFIGPIPEGLELDHLCRVRRCVNPEHLDPVPHQTNVLRSPIAIGAINGAKTHCRAGHPFSAENTRFSMKGKQPMRVCRACSREAGARYKARQRALRSGAIR